MAAALEAGLTMLDDVVGLAAPELRERRLTAVSFLSQVGPGIPTCFCQFN